MVFKQFPSSQIPSHGLGEPVAFQTLVNGVALYSVNRGAGYGLEIPVRYELVGIQKAVEWANRCVSRISGMPVSKTEKSLK